MSADIKHLSFKGIEKKEQILFKSFLNLAKNELEYQVVILKDSDTSGQLPDIVIADCSYQFSGDEADLGFLPTIRIGNEPADAELNILRPVQWSDFKTELTRLDLDAKHEPQSSNDQVLPQEMEFAIVEMDEKSESDSENDSGDFDEAENYDYELDKLSIDYHSFTNSEYLKVVDDVKGFKDKEGEGDTTPIDPNKPLVLITDDESASNNSVLILETNSLDAWEMSESEFDADDDDDDDVQLNDDSTESESVYVDAKAEAEITRKLKTGAEVTPGNQFWSEDAEIFSGRKSLMYIKPERDMVYASIEPGKWTASIRQNTITKVPLHVNWKPTNELKAYPVSSLVWANTIATKSGALAPVLDSQTEYILERWPHFDLLELDNMLLKLCTMMFVRAESPYSLMQKSGYSRTVVYGLVNACHELDILRVAEEFDLEKFSEMNADAGMFGKIKDVFRT